MHSETVSEVACKQPKNNKIKRRELYICSFFSELFSFYAFLGKPFCMCTYHKLQGMVGHFHVITQQCIVPNLPLLRKHKENNQTGKYKKKIIYIYKYKKGSYCNRFCVGHLGHIFTRGAVFP